MTFIRRSSLNTVHGDYVESFAKSFDKRDLCLCRLDGAKRNAGGISGVIDFPGFHCVTSGLPVKIDVVGSLDEAQRNPGSARNTLNY